MNKEVKRLVTFSFGKSDFPDDLKEMIKDIRDQTLYCNIIQDYYEKNATVLKQGKCDAFNFAKKIRDANESNKLVIAEYDDGKVIYYTNLYTFEIVTVDTSRLWLQEEYDGALSISYFKVCPNTNQLIRDDEIKLR